MNENPALSTRQLDAFVALAEHRSFTRAAMQCHLSQPAFSALIKALETRWAHACLTAARGMWI